MNRLGAVALLLLITPVVLPLLPAHAAPLLITKVQSGLLAQDSLTTGNTAYWYFYVDAVLTGAPLTRDCTIITNGSNLMKVYLDGRLVYSSSTLNLQMPSPFNSYLEVQSTYAGGMLHASYNDYYATVSDAVRVQNAPPGDTAQV